MLELYFVYNGHCKFYLGMFDNVDDLIEQMEDHQLWNVRQERKRKMINNVTLVGRLTKDPELKHTPSNVAVATFTLAVNRNFKGANGEREADFINCMMWRKQAELFAEWCKKGNLVGVTGRIQTRNYENQEGRRVYLTEVVADGFERLEKRDDTANRSNIEEQMPGYALEEDDFPF